MAKPAQAKALKKKSRCRFLLQVDFELELPNLFMKLPGMNLKIHDTSAIQVLSRLIHMLVCKLQSRGLSSTYLTYKEN